MNHLQLSRLLTEIDDAIESDDRARALRLTLTNWHSLPDPSPLRERVAVMLASLGRKREAVEIYELAARHYANAGYPSRALAAIKQVTALQPNITVLLDHFTTLYNIRSPYLDTSRIQNEIPTPDEPLRFDPDEQMGDPDALMEMAIEQALDTAGTAHEPDRALPALPLLSLLPADTLRRVLDLLEYEIFAQTQPVLEKGTRPQDLLWTVSADLLIGDDDEGFRLPGGALLGLSGFGQSAAPIQQTIMSQKGSELLRLNAEAIERLSREFGDFQNRLATLRRHALTEGLVCRHPIFKDLDDEDRLAIMNQFIGLRVSKEETLIYQDAPSPGLFVVLDGKVDIIRKDDWEITIASLDAGQVFGEVGLVSDTPAIASVVMTTPGHLLFLSRDDFGDLAQRYPSMAKYAVNLANTRIQEVNDTLSGQDVQEVD